jgi:hypothetical protein
MTFQLLKRQMGGKSAEERVTLGSLQAWKYTLQSSHKSKANRGPVDTSTFEGRSCLWSASGKSRSFIRLQTLNNYCATNAGRQTAQPGKSQKVTQRTSRFLEIGQRCSRASRIHGMTQEKDRV